MAKSILNIARTYANGFIADFEKSKYFQLNKNVATRADLYGFAIACAMMENKAPTAPQAVGPVDTFVRVEYLANYETLFSCLYYEKALKDDPDRIDQICNRDEVYDMAEKYANTGFGILKDWNENITDETLLYKLIDYMDKRFREIKDEVDSFV